MRTIFANVCSSDGLWFILVYDTCVGRGRGLIIDKGWVHKKVEKRRGRVSMQPLIKWCSSFISLKQAAISGRAGGPSFTFLERLHHHIFCFWLDPLGVYVHPQRHSLYSKATLGQTLSRKMIYLTLRDSWGSLGFQLCGSNHQTYSTFILLEHFSVRSNRLASVARTSQRQKKEPGRGKGTRAARRKCCE